MTRQITPGLSRTDFLDITPINAQPDILLPNPATGATRTVVPEPKESSSNALSELLGTDTNTMLLIAGGLVVAFILLK